jgi:hypothetical protein
MVYSNRKITAEQLEETQLVVKKTGKSASKRKTIVWPE